MSVCVGYMSKSKDKRLTVANPELGQRNPIVIDSRTVKVGRVNPIRILTDSVACMFSKCSANASVMIKNVLTHHPEGNVLSGLKNDDEDHETGETAETRVIGEGGSNLEMTASESGDSESRSRTTAPIPGPSAEGRSGTGSTMGACRPEPPLPHHQMATRSTTGRLKSKRDFSPPQSPPPPKKQAKENPTVKETNSSSTGTPETKTRKQWELWSQEDKKMFFQALNEFGKDFEAIHSLMQQKHAKKGTPVSLVKSRDQIRFFYYRTWHKLMKHVEVNDLDDYNKAALELYSLINYGEMRKRIGCKINDKIGQTLNSLVHRGSAILKIKGKNHRIRTPLSRTLKKLNRIRGPQEDRKLKAPEKVVVELVPHTNAAWTQVQSCAFNPRLRMVVKPDRRLSSVIDYLNLKWRPDRVRLKEALNEHEESVKELKLRPGSDCTLVPVHIKPMPVPSRPELSFDKYVQARKYLIETGVLNSSPQNKKASKSSSAPAASAGKGDEGAGCLINPLSLTRSSSLQDSQVTSTVEGDKTHICSADNLDGFGSAITTLCGYPIDTFGSDVRVRGQRTLSLTSCSNNSATTVGADDDEDDDVDDDGDGDDDGEEAKMEVDIELDEAGGEENANMYDAMCKTDDTPEGGNLDPKAKTDGNRGTLLQEGEDLARDGNPGIFPQEGEDRARDGNPGTLPQEGEDLARDGNLGTLPQEGEDLARDGNPGTLPQEGEDLTSKEPAAEPSLNKREIIVAEVKVDKLKGGVVQSEADDITVAEVFYMMGGPSKVVLEYDWVEKRPSEDNIFEMKKNLTNMLRRLVNLATTEFTDFRKVKPVQNFARSPPPCCTCGAMERLDASNTAAAKVGRSPRVSGGVGRVTGRSPATPKQMLKEEQPDSPSLVRPSTPTSAQATVILPGSPMAQPLPPDTILSPTSGNPQAGDSVFRVPTAAPPRIQARPTPAVATNSQGPNKNILSLKHELFMPRKGRRLQRNIRKPLIVQRTLLPKTRVPARQIMTLTMVPASASASQTGSFMPVQTVTLPNAVATQLAVLPNFPPEASAAQQQQQQQLSQETDEIKLEDAPSDELGGQIHHQVPTATTTISNPCATSSSASLQQATSKLGSRAIGRLRRIVPIPVTTVTDSIIFTSAPLLSPNILKKAAADARIPMETCSSGDSRFLSTSGAITSRPGDGREPSGRPRALTGVDTFLSGPGADTAHTLTGSLRAASPPSMSSLLDISVPSVNDVSESTDKLIDMALGNSCASFSGLLENSLPGGKPGEKDSGGDLATISSRAMSPSKHFRVISTLKADEQWLNGDDFSLSNLLPEPPAASSKRTSSASSSVTMAAPPVAATASVSSQCVFSLNDSSRDSCILAKMDVDATLQTLLNENSMDYMAKFADLAAKMADKAHKDPPAVRNGNHGGAATNATANTNFVKS